MTFQRLKWLGILAPLLLFLLVQVGVRVLLRETERMHAHLLLDGTVVVIATLLYVAIFLAIGRRIYVLERENRELAALRAAGLDIVSELSLEVVLQKVVDQARALIETRYGALAVYDESGAIQSFVTSGIDSALRQKIGNPPVGKGLLGVAMQRGQSIRTEDISADPRSCGLPAHHPMIRSLLAVPVICRGPFRGNLYLSERLDGKPFTKLDEETLIRFASQTAIAVDNAHLHARVRSLAVVEERLRLSREMHDGQA
ncbi:MAG: GAF domain-containing protein, partial [Holophagales bacterium]|nr:GAF domain-containing protein [Holophagales bacterium]